MICPSDKPANMIFALGSSALHSRSGTNKTGSPNPKFSAQFLPSDVSSIHFTAHFSFTFRTNSSSVNSLQADDARKPVQVSMLIFCHKSSDFGKGGWSKAKISLRWFGHHSDGSVPEMEQMILSTMPAGLMNIAELFPTNRLTANCIVSAQIGAAPVKPLESVIGE